MPWYMFLIYGILVIGAFSSAFNAHLQWRWYKDYVDDKNHENKGK